VAQDPYKDGGTSAFSHRKLRQLIKTPGLIVEIHAPTSRLPDTHGRIRNTKKKLGGVFLPELSGAGHRSSPLTRAPVYATGYADELDA